MPTNTFRIAEKAFCRIGGLEGSRYKLRRFVEAFCRIGGLEVDEVAARARLFVFCRIGGLEVVSSK